MSPAEMGLLIKAARRHLKGKIFIEGDNAETMRGAWPHHAAPRADNAGGWHNDPAPESDDSSNVGRDGRCGPRLRPAALCRGLRQQDWHLMFTLSASPLCGPIPSGKAPPCLCGSIHRTHPRASCFTSLVNVTGMIPPAFDVLSGCYTAKL